MGGQRQGGGGISVSLSLVHSYLTCSSCSQATPRVLLARTTNERSMPPPPTSDAATNPRTKIPKHFPPTRNKLLYYRKKKTALGPVAGGVHSPGPETSPPTSFTSRGLSFQTLNGGISNLSENKNQRPPLPSFPPQNRDKRQKNRKPNDTDKKKK